MISTSRHQELLRVAAQRARRRRIFLIADPYQNKPSRVCARKRHGFRRRERRCNQDLPAQVAWPENRQRHNSWIYRICLRGQSSSWACRVASWKGLLFDRSSRHAYRLDSARERGCGLLRRAGAWEKCRRKTRRVGAWCSLRRARKLYGDWRRLSAEFWKRKALLEWASRFSRMACSQTWLFSRASAI